MKQIEDAGRKRRTYIWKKTAANTVAGFGGCAACGFTMLAVLIGIPLVFSFVALIVSVGAIDLFATVFYLVGLLILALLGGLAFLGIRIYESFDRKARFLRYVAPVPEQIAALPADEILLRGSDQPPAATGELLRAAHQTTKTCAEELVRPTATTSI